MKGVFLKSIREVSLITLLLGFGLLAVEALLEFVLPQVMESFSSILTQVPFLRLFVSALLGVDVGDKFTVQMMQATLWGHPVVLVQLWAHAIVVCTRLPAGEIDRGSADILLALPVSRRAMWVADTGAWLLGGVVIIALAWVGHLIGSRFVPAGQRIEPVRTLMIVANMFCLYFVVAGASCLVSSFCNSRGRAIAIVFSVLLASFLLNFISPFWEPAQAVAFLSVLDHYRPATILMDGEFPVVDAVILLGSGVVMWAAGAEIFARRSVCTI